MDHSGPPRHTVEPPTVIKHSKGHPTAKCPNASAPSHQPCAPHTMIMNQKDKFFLAPTSHVKWLKKHNFLARRFITLTFIQVGQSSERTSFIDSNNLLSFKWLFGKSWCSIENPSFKDYKCVVRTPRLRTNNDEWAYFWRRRNFLHGMLSTFCFALLYSVHLRSTWLV